jgi:hypothetical protein
MDPYYCPLPPLLLLPPPLLLLLLRVAVQLLAPGCPLRLRRRALAAAAETQCNRTEGRAP